ncbi:MAG TPA: glycosyltransferase family 1 protein, partial [Desulfurivibrio alkaliphilus]|nr:glycosyltransferase family 1 protein [Desulfurivibrio alkaliphilus]
MARLLQVGTVAITLRTFLLPIADHFTKKGWRVDALAHGAASVPRPPCFAECWEIGWSRNPWSVGSLWRAMARVREVVDRGDYDIVHVHTPVAAFITRLALARWRRAGRPQVIYTAHGFHFHRGGRPWKNVLFRGLEKLAGRWTDYLVVI